MSVRLHSLVLGAAVIGLGIAGMLPAAASEADTTERPSLSRSIQALDLEPSVATRDPIVRPFPGSGASAKAKAMKGAAQTMKGASAHKGSTKADKRLPKAVPTEI